MKTDGRTRARKRAGRARRDVVPVEDVLAERRVPARCGGESPAAANPSARGARRRERRLRVARVAGPPADRDLLRVHRVAHDEVGRRRSAGAREQAHREVERAPPRVDRGRAAPVRGAERGEHERRARRRGEVGRDLRRRRRCACSSSSSRGTVHGDLLRRRVDLDRRRRAP